MPYREKAAWLSLFAIAITYGPYFIYVAHDPDPNAALPNLRLMAVFALAAGVQAVIQIAGRILLRVTSGEDARTPADERDLIIERRSIGAAYYVLMAGMILVGCVMPFTNVGWSIVNTAIALITAAELVHYGIAVVCYRRQA